MTGTAAALLTRGVRRTFDANRAPVRALRGVDLQVANGEFVALVGPSGSGKSTLLNIAAGLDRPNHGEVYVSGELISGRDEEWLALMRRQHIGFVFQFFHLLDGMTALENVVLAGVIGGMSRRNAEVRARHLMDLLAIADKVDEMPSILSGGQRQRLAIARALVNRPTLLLADEPTGALDSAGGLEVLELFRRLHAEGQTILMVTHSAEVAAGAGRIVTLRDGRIASDVPESLAGAAVK